MPKQPREATYSPRKRPAQTPGAGVGSYAHQEHLLNLTPAEWRIYKDSFSPQKPDAFWAWLLRKFLDSMTHKRFFLPLVFALVALAHSGCSANAPPSLNSSLAGQRTLPRFRQPNAFGAASSTTKQMLYAYAKEVALMAIGENVDTELGNYLVDFLPGTNCGVVDEEHLAESVRKIRGAIRTDRELSEILGYLWPAEINLLAHGLPEFAATTTVNGRDFSDATRGFLEQYILSYGERSVAAQTLRPNPAWTLFGFSRCIDAKATLNNASLQTLLTRMDVNVGELEGYLQTQPEGPLDTPTKLLGALLGHIANDGGSSVRINLDSPMKQWVETVLGAVFPDYSMAQGCNPAFAANIDAAMTASDTDRNRTYFDSGEDTLPAQQVTYFARNVRFVGGDMSPPDFEGRRQNDPALRDPNTLARVNFAFEAAAGEKFRFPSGREITVPTTGARCNMSTNVERNTPTLHAALHDEGVLEGFAQQLGLFYVAGLHYTAAYDDEQRTCVLNDFVSHATRMKAANPSLLVHHQYVEFKNPSAEAEAFELLQKSNRAFTSMDLNARELAPLIRNIASRFPDATAGIQTALPDGSKTTEALQLVYPMAVWLLETLQLERLSVHAFRYDLLLRRKSSTESATSFANKTRDSVADLLKSTQLAASKMANATGEIKTPSDIVPFYWYTTQPGVSEVLRFWYLLEQNQYPTTAAALLNNQSLWPRPTDAPLQGNAEAFDRATGWKQAALDGYYLSGDFSVIVVPTPQYYVETGGKISLGDTRSFAPLRNELSGTHAISFGD
jgi:hypothetical protein